MGASKEMEWKLDVFVYGTNKFVAQQTNCNQGYFFFLHKSEHSPQPSHITGTSLLLNNLALPNMTRRKWTTDEQEVWLEQRKSAYLEANQKKTAAKDFFPAVVEEFRQKWPVPPVTEEEITDAGSVELATRVKQGKYDKVGTSRAHS